MRASFAIVLAGALCACGRFGFDPITPDSLQLALPILAAMVASLL